MRVVVTAGPTFEPLDRVRRLTNFSTGRLGSELAGFLTDHGHNVELLVGEAATVRDWQATHVQTFGTTADLRERLRALATAEIAAVFHAAAVSDFAFGKVWHTSAGDHPKELGAGKIPTRVGSLMAELVPTPKIITELRGWYPQAYLVGWKFEVDGERAQVLELARKQIKDCRTDACVANGPAYGSGFGLLRKTGECMHLAARLQLFEELAKLS